jgi:hypothetical protein
VVSETAFNNPWDSRPGRDEEMNKQARKQRRKAINRE